MIVGKKETKSAKSTRSFSHSQCPLFRSSRQVELWKTQKESPTGSRIDGSLTESPKSVKQETLNEDKAAEQKTEDKGLEDDGAGIQKDKSSAVKLSLTNENTEEDVQISTPGNATYADEDSAEEIETDEDGVIADGNVLDDVNNEGIEDAVEEALDDGFL